MLNKLIGSKGNNTISELDGLRGLAVCMVFFYHIIGVIGIREWYMGKFNILPFMMWGHFGVNIFYTLSAFLLFIPFAKLYRDKKENDLKKYAIKRALRILPSFYFYIIVFVFCVNPELMSVDGIKSMLGNMLFLQNYTNIIPFNDTVWTLAIEVQFYILIPFIYKYVMRSKNKKLLFYSIGFVFLYRVGIAILIKPDMISYNRQYYVMSEYNLLGCLDNFMIGILIAKIYMDNKYNLISDKYKKVLIKASRNIIYISPIVIIFLMYNYYIWSYEVSRFHTVFFNFFFDITLYIVIAALFIELLFNKSKLNSVFNLTILRFMGRISYSLYIWHLFFQARIANISVIANSNSIAVKYILMVSFSIIIIIPFSTLMYLLVEKPFIKMAKNI